MIIIKTPVSRVGNKTPILNIIYSLFPLKYNRFIEVFGGSGAVLLGKPRVDPFEVWNDFDKDLVNLFRCMKKRTMAVIRELGFVTLNSRDDFNVLVRFFHNEKFDDDFLNEELELTQIMLEPPKAEELIGIMEGIAKDYDVIRAANFLKLLRYSYSSSGRSYASQPFDIRKLFGLIEQLKDRLANVVIENQDFGTLITHYDRSDSLFYCDPPYYSTEDMYAVEFSKEDHARLYHTLNNIKGKFLLSYNDCPEIRELYKDYNIFDFTRLHSMQQRTKAGARFKELLIANYDFYERIRKRPLQLNLFENYNDKDEKRLKECIVTCKIPQW